jgi:hypothetical protein
MGVTKCIDRETRQQIQVSPSVRIPEIAPLAAYEYALRRAEGVHHRLGVRLEHRL